MEEQTTTGPGADGDKSPQAGPSQSGEKPLPKTPTVDELLDTVQQLRQNQETLAQALAAASDDNQELERRCEEDQAKIAELRAALSTDADKVAVEAGFPTQAEVLEERRRKLVAEFDLEEIQEVDSETFNPRQAYEVRVLNNSPDNDRPILPPKVRRFLVTAEGIEPLIVGNCSAEPDSRRKFAEVRGVEPHRLVMNTIELKPTDFRVPLAAPAAKGDPGGE